MKQQKKIEYIFIEKDEIVLSGKSVFKGYLGECIDGFIKKYKTSYGKTHCSIVDGYRINGKIKHKTIKKYGHNYNVTVNSGNFNFPTKEYENVKFPKGKYYALKVVIGKGEGENWWCVLYPQLCFDYTESGALSKESDTKLKNVLTYDEYTTITSKSNLNFKFKILEWFSS